MFYIVLQEWVLEIINSHVYKKE